MSKTPNLKERLLSTTPVDPGLREQYESELKAIIHQQLRPSERWYYGAMALVTGLFAILFGVAVVYLNYVDTTIRALMVVAGVHCLVNAVRVGIVVRRGQFDRRKSTKWRIGAVYYAAVFAVWLTGASRLGRPGVSSDLIIMMFLPILAGLVVFCVGWICHVIAQAEMRTREEMLEMKLHLASIARELKERDR